MNLNPRPKKDSKKKTLEKYEKIKKMIEKEVMACNCVSGCRHDFAGRLWKVIK